MTCEEQGALAVRAKSDPRAFAAFFRSIDGLVRQRVRYVARVYRCRSIDREDLHAAAWSAIWRYTLPNFDPSRGNIRSLVAQMAYLAARQLVQEAMKEPFPERFDDVGGEGRTRHELVASSAATPEEQLIGADARTKLEAAGRRLGPRLRHVLDAHLDGCGTREIARRLGYSRASAWEDVRRLVPTLRRLMGVSAA